MKKIALLGVLLFASSMIAFAQRNPAELNFQKQRTTYTREHFSEGEDASSGFDYVYFRRGKGIVMIRSIWSATHTPELRVEDMYFDGGVLAFFQRSTARKNSLTVLKGGRNTGLSPKEEMHFERGKLTRWVENGKTVTKSESWPETEKSTLERAKSLSDYYAELKGDN